MNPTCKYTRGGLMGVAACIGFFGILMTDAGPRMAPAAHAVSAPAANAPLKPAVSPTQAQAQPVPALAEKPEFPIGHNFALASNGGTAIGGSDPAQLIDGNDTNYSGGTGFATTQWRAEPAQTFTIALKNPVTLDCVRMLLWDRSDERFYRYKLEACADELGKSWSTIADRTGPTEQCKSWQVLRFKPQTIKQFKLTGTYNSANNGFHVVEFQAFNGCPPAAASASPDSLDF